MSIKKIERAKSDSKRKIDQMKKLCYIELENVLSKGTLIASNPSENENYLVKEIRKTTPERLRHIQKEGMKSHKNLRDKSNLKSFIISLLNNLFENSNVSKSEVDKFFALTDSYGAIERPEDIFQLIDSILAICEDELEYSPTKIESKSPRIAGNELKAKFGALGAAKIMESELQLKDPPSGYIDLSTYLSGFFTLSEKDNLGLVSGLGLEILDALAGGRGKLNQKHGTILQLPTSSGEIYKEIVADLAPQVSNLIKVGRVPSGDKRVGGIPIDVRESYNQKVRLIGCDVGKNGNKLGEITELGRRAASYGLATLDRLIDKSFARLVGKIIKSLYEEELITSESSICISSRQVLSEKKFEIMSGYLEEMGFEKIAKNMFFVENPTSFGILEINRD